MITNWRDLRRGGKLSFSDPSSPAAPAGLGPPATAAGRRQKDNGFPWTPSRFHGKRLRRSFSVTSYHSAPKANLVRTERLLKRKRFCTMYAANSTAPFRIFVETLMMILFICSCRNINQSNAIYPLGTLHRGLKKAHVMVLPSCPLWYYADPFPPLVDVVVH